MLFDSHAHLDSFPDPDALSAALDRATAASVTRICAVGSTPDANRLAFSLAADRPSAVCAAVGYDRDQISPAPDLAPLRDQLASPLARAVGETGLDYHYSPDTARPQRALFESMLGLALDFAKPVVVHTREADADTLAMLRDYADQWRRSVSPDRPPAVLHCFVGGPAFADALLELGLSFSFSGILTFRNADALRQTAARLPLDRLLVETDTPYLAPVPLRGQPNEPSFLPHVAAKLAEIRGLPPSAVADATTRNASRFFQWPATENQPPTKETEP